VVYPSNAVDAKGLLLTAFEDPNPVMVFEHKALYRSTKEQVADGYYNIPFGEAKLVHEGNRVSIITYGMGVHWALKMTEENNIDADILDLRTLVPLDTESIYKSVRKTGKVLVLHEDNLFGGIGGEIASLINENCFESLDAPVKRLGSLDTPVPFINEKEDNYLASSKLKETLDYLLAY
jgi:2-oxoisovalerate dehydrogenase E1 component